MWASLSRGASWVLGALLLYAVYSAVRIGAADILFIAAADAAKSPATLAVASSKLDWARRLTPDDPERLQDLATLASRLAIQPGVGQSDKQALLQAGMAHARSALAIRPDYAYGWAVLLRLKSLAREYDAEFRRALAATMKLGPWEPGLQALAFDVGLGAWAALSAEEQTAVVSGYLRGMHRQEETMSGILRRHSSSCFENVQSTGCAR